MMRHLFLTIAVLAAGMLSGCMNAGGLKVGEAAPDFSAATMDGKEVSLSSLRGKFVLLDFWATWCKPCLAEMPHLAEVWKEHGEDPRFAFIGMNLDADKGALEKYLDSHDEGWPQVPVSRESDIPEKYRIQTIPNILLIGPDGVVVASGLRGKKIGAAVEQALKE